MDNKAELEAKVLAWCRRKSSENMAAAVDSAMGYIKGIASRIQNPVSHLVSREDLIQYGLMGFLSALKRYEPDKGTFRTWSYPRIKGAMIDGVRAMSPTSKTRNSPMLSFEELEPKLGQLVAARSIENDVIPESASKVLVEAVQILPTMHALVILFLLNGVKGKALAGILNISETRVQQLRAEAVEQLSALLSDNTEATISEILNNGVDAC